MQIGRTLLGIRMTEAYQYGLMYSHSYRLGQGWRPERSIMPSQPR